MQDPQKLEELVSKMRARDAAEGVINEQEIPVPVSIPAMETEKSPFDCKRCGVTFLSTALMASGSVIARAEYCEKCLQAHNDEARAEEAEAIRWKRQAEWERICPEDYRETDVERIRRNWINAGIRPQMRRSEDSPLKPTTVDEILALEAKDGILVFGVSGLCKTRLVFKLIERFHFAGTRVAYINGATFADRLAAQYADGAKAAEQFIQKHIMAPVCFYDDLGKEPLTRDRKMSERSEESLYRILEERKAAKRPFHGTTNLPNKNAFLNRLSEDRGAPMVRRLLQMAVVVIL